VVAYFVCPVTDHDDDIVNTSSAEVIEASTDDGFLAERKKRLERSHATRTTGGKNYCSSFGHRNLKTIHTD
jgi:hypothetical protein